MPFNGSGTFTIVNTFVPNTTILSSAVNANFTDIATGLSDCLTRDGQAGMTAALKVIAGTAGAPSITFTSDTKTGMYLVSSGNLGLTSNGVLAAEFDQFQVAQFQQAAEAKLFCLIDTSRASTSSNINTLATAGTGAIAIGTSTNWPTNGYLIAGNEVMNYTVASANGLTINVRGALGTTNISHATGSSISYLFTSVAQQTLLLPARATASRSASAIPGELGYNTGSSQPEYWNSSVWVGMAPPNLTPQGYLSPTAGVTVVTADVTGAATIFYNPAVGNLLPVPNAGVFTVQTFATASIALNASQQTTAGIYDVFAFNAATSGVLTFGIGPSWAAGSGSITAGTCARGTGAGSAALTAIGGFNTNTVAQTMFNGASSYTVATASGIYLGSVFIDGTAAQVTCHRSFGQNRKFGIWNAFNKVGISLQAGEATASWNYTTATIRASNAQPASWASPSFNFGSGVVCNGMTIFTGLAEEIVLARFMEANDNTTAAVVSKYGIGVNSTTAFTGVIGQGITNSGAGSNPISRGTAFAEIAPTLGLTTLCCCEFSAATGTTTWFGTATNMLLIASYRG